MSRPMTRRYLKRIGMRPGDIWPYEMEEAEAKLRAAISSGDSRKAASALSAEGRGLRAEGRRLGATGVRVSFRMAAALLDEARQFQRGRATAEAATAEAATAEATTAEATTADPSGGAPEPPCQSRSGGLSVPRNREANIALTPSGGERSGTVPEANVTVTEATAEATITEVATPAPIYAASS